MTPATPLFRTEKSMVQTLPYNTFSLCAYGTGTGTSSFLHLEVGRKRWHSTTKAQWSELGNDPRSPYSWPRVLATAPDFISALVGMILTIDLVKITNQFLFWQYLWKHFYASPQIILGESGDFALPFFSWVLFPSCLNVQKNEENYQETKASLQNLSALY